MRPRIVDFLNQISGTSLFDGLVPYPATVYAITMLACLIVFVRRCRADQLSAYHAISAGIWAMAGGLIGARLFFLGMHLEQVASHPQIIFSVAGGTASWGAYLGGTAAFLIYFRLRKVNSLRYLDVLGSLMGLGPFLGRWACFLNGDDFGTLSDVSWAVVYPHASLPFVHQVSQGLISPLADFSLPVHPVQLYLSLNGLALFILFSYLWKRRRQHPGRLFLWFWLTYAVTRFFLEFFRGAVPRDYLTVFSLSQLMTLLIALAALAALGLTRHYPSPRKKAVPAETIEA